MLKSILLVEESSRTISMHSLQQNCRTIHRAGTIADSKAFISVVDAVVLHVPLSKMNAWLSSLSGMRKLPIVWLCSENEAAKEIDWGFALDGILFSSMNSIEMQYALKWSLRVFQQRKRWADERDQLLQRLEERKWIDQAKTVLCEIKGISEAEAYDFLRKQAMNERKRIGDIAASIVKVYQLIHG